MKSQPKLASVSAAADSLAGSNQLSIITSLTLMFGFADCAAIAKELTPNTTSGTLNEPR